MPEEATEQGSRLNAKIVGVITALVTSVIAVPATYFINAHLDRDRVSIEATEASYEMANYEVDAEKFTKLLQGSGENYLTEFNIWLNGQEQSVIALLRGRTRMVFDEAERDKLVRAMAEAKGFLEKRSAKIKDFRVHWNKDKDEQRLSGLLHEAISLRIISESPPPPAPEEIGEAAVKKIKDIERLKALAIGIGTDAKRFSQTRTGDVQVLVTLVNAGSTDGLVKAEGYLEVAPLQIRLPVMEWEGKVQKIEKRSIKEIWFRVNEPRANTEDLSTLRKSVKDGKPLSGNLELRDFRNDKIRSSRFEFPAMAGK